MRVEGGPIPRLHLVTDDDVLAAADFGDVAGALMNAAGSGGTEQAGLALHVRGPHTSGRRLHELTSSLAERARAAGVLLVVNDRVDVALTGGASAVHLGGRSLPVAEARRLLGVDARVGVSTHTPAEATEAATEGADWIFMGTVYPSRSHLGRRGCGAEGLEAAVAATAGTGGVPVLAIGGVTPRRVAEVMAVGAWGVAVIRGVWDAPDPVEAMKEYLEALAAEGGAD